MTRSLIARARERLYVIGAAARAGVNLALNLLPIPAWGGMGHGGHRVRVLRHRLSRRPRPGADLPARPHLLTGVIVVLAVSIGWWALPEAPAKRALLALAVSVASWEAASPWTWRKLWPGAARHGL